MSDSAATPVVTDATGAGPVTVTNRTVGGIVLLLSKSCAVGAEIHVVPATAAHVSAAAKAADGNLAGVVLAPQQRVFRVTADVPGRPPLTIHVRLAP